MHRGWGFQYQFSNRVKQHNHQGIAPTKFQANDG